MRLGYRKVSLNQEGGDKVSCKQGPGGERGQRMVVLAGPLSPLSHSLREEGVGKGLEPSP